MPATPGVFLVEARTRVRRARSRAHQLETMTRMTQPVIRMAAALVLLERKIPRRRGKNLDVLLAYMFSCADWKSGRRSRPGRADSAAILDVQEDTVRKLWRRLEDLELITNTCTGIHLSREQVAEQEPEEYHVADRSEWTMRNAPGVYAEDVTPEHIERAVGAFAALAERLAEMDADLAPLEGPLAAMSESWRRLLAARSEQGEKSYICPINGFLFSTLPHKVCSSSPSTAYGQKDKKDGATRRPKSATTSGRPGKRAGSKRRMNPDALDLAYELLGEDRLPQLRGSDIRFLASTVHSRAVAGWKVSDVVRAVQAACQRRSEQYGYFDPPKRQDVRRASAWLKAMLAEVEDLYPVDIPPHRAAAAAAEELRADRRTAAQERRAQADRRAEPGSQPRIVIPARRRAHTGPEDLFADSVAARQRAARIEREDQEHAATWQPRVPAAPRCELCGNPGRDVVFRFLPSRGSVECCEGCHAWHSRNPILHLLDL